MLLKRERVTAKIVFHSKAKVQAAQHAARYLARHDFNEAARWADAAKAHRFAADSLRELLGD